MAVHYEHIRNKYNQLKQHPKLGFRIFLCILHSCVSAVILVFMFACKTSQFNQSMYGMKAFDYAPYALSSYNDYTCNSTVACFRNAMPWSDGYALPNLSFNPYIALFTFQWITTAFSLFYISRNMQEITGDWERVKKGLKYGSIACNMVGWGIYVIYFFVYGQNNWLEISLYSVIWVLSSLLILLFDMKLHAWAATFPKVLVDGEMVESASRLWNIPAFMKNDEGESEMLVVDKKGMELPELMVERMQVVMRYLEYTCTAPILFVAIMNMMVVGAPYWATMMGYTCMVGCCLYGVPLHLMHVQEVTIELFKKIKHHSEEQMFALSPPVTVSTMSMKNDLKKPIIKASIMGNPLDEGKITYIYRYNELEQAEGHRKNKNFFWSLILMGKWRSNWVVKMHYLQNAWFGVVMALSFVVYLARNVLFSNILPDYVLACIWMLLAMYTSFGLVGTLYYYFLDRKYWHTMDLAMETLSFLAKAPIVMTLCAGYWNMPGNSCF